jgi:hypothetical protein
MEITGRRSGPKRIGELLVAANVIRQEVLLEALKVSKNSQTPLGRVLMSIGELSERDLEAAIYVQSLIRQEVISSDFGVKAINVAVKAKIPLDEAFRRLGWTPPSFEEEANRQSAGDLGELLIQSGLVDRNILEQALYQSHENNLPLGRCLVLGRALTSNMLQSALTAQVLIRDGKISQEQAVASLKKSFQRAQTLEQSLFDTGAFRVPDKDGIKFGDLLTQAGIVTEGDKISAIEVGLAENQMIGEVLVQSGMISPGVVDESLRLQHMVTEGKISGLQAADILRQAHVRNVSIDVIMEEKETRQVEVARVNEVLELLLGAQVLSGDAFNRAQSLARQLNVPLAEVIIIKEMVDKRVINAAVQGHQLVQEGLLKQGQCIAALKMVIKSGLEFHEVLKDLPSDSAMTSGNGTSSAATSSQADSSLKDDDSGKKGWLGKFFGPK